VRDFELHWYVTLYGRVDQCPVWGYFFPVCWMLAASRQPIEADFECSLGSAESDIDDNSLCSALVLCGPHGVGKTSMVYAVAKELGFKVSSICSLFCGHVYTVRLGGRFCSNVITPECLAFDFSVSKSCLYSSQVTVK